VTVSFKCLIIEYKYVPCVSKMYCKLIAVIYVSVSFFRQN